MIVSCQNLIKIFIFLYIISSQFYFYPGGDLQHSHIFFAIFSLFLLLFSIKRKINLSFLNYYTFIGLFFFYAFFVNLYYSFLYQEVTFLVATLHFFVGIYIAFNVSLYLFHFNSIKFFQTCLFISLLLLFFFYIFEIGNYEFLPRYNAFFYGPAQMAHWALCIFACYGLIFKELASVKDKAIFIIIFFLTLTIILASGTRSAYFSILFMFIGSLFILTEKKIINNFYIFIFFFIILILILLINKDMLQATFERFMSFDLSTQLVVRGYSRIYDYYEYILFGSGQGLDERFYLASSIFDDVYTEYSFEIHSTFVAIFFYYGIFGFIFFFSFLFKIFKNLYFVQKIFFLIPFFYSLTTYNARTPIFWFFIGVSIFVSAKNFKNKKL
jgi:hypothetical protein